MMNSWEEFELIMAKGEIIPLVNRKTLFTNCIVDDSDTISNGSSVTRDGTSCISVSSVGTSYDIGSRSRKPVTKPRGGL